MSTFVAWARTLALAWGAPGLCLIAFLDSSILPLPAIADILLIILVTRKKEWMPLYVIATTLGSLAGCMTMHYVGKKGGEALVRKRFATAGVERAMAALRRHGIMAVLIPSLLPPPAPFKIFLLLAAAAGIDAKRFAAAIIIGRGVRYLTIGLLAVRYGARAETYIRANGPMLSLVAVCLLVGFFVYLQWRKAAGRGGPTAK